MVLIESPHGFALTLKNGRRLFVSSPSKDAFRIREAGVDSSKAPSLHLNVNREKDGVRFISHKASLLLHDDGSIAICKSGRLIAAASPIIPPASSIEKDGLSAKEGHKPEGEFSFSKEGYAFVNDSPVYGLGDKTGPLDKRGYSYVNWNTDDPSAQVDTFKSLYKSIPFFVMFHRSESIGVYLDNTGRSLFDFNKNDSRRIEVSYEEGLLDLYLFVGSLIGVCESFSSLVGRPPLPPRWSLGYQQSRWSYGDEKEVEDVLANYREIDVPVSVIHLDIAYMEQYEDFTIDSKRFPDFSAWAETLLRQGVHLVTIIDAGIKALPGYFMYDEGEKGNHFATLKGRIYHNEVWPGDSVFPAFIKVKTQQWWASHVEKLLNQGVSGIWNDMNEPASFKGPLPPDVDMGGLPHSLAHNIYGDRMAKATYMGFMKAKRRPFIITRAAYATTSRYSTMWTGDNQAIWDHLRLTIPQQCNLSISGVQMIGNDIGGFGGDTTKELLIRWIELGLFSPLMRNHSAYGTRRQEGYAFDEETSRIYSKAVHLRYELIPYFYDKLREAEAHGTPVYRPLIMNFPSDSRLVDENTEFMIGEALLVAPALFPGERFRSVYFPGVFYDFFSGKRFAKGDHLVNVPLDRIPLFVKRGSLVPLGEKGTSSPEFGATLRLLTTKGDASYVHYEDSGDGLGYLNGEFNLFQIEKKKAALSVSYIHEGMKTHYGAIELVDFQGHEKKVLFGF